MTDKSTAAEEGGTQPPFKIEASASLLRHSFYNKE